MINDALPVWITGHRRWEIRCGCWKIVLVARGHAWTVVKRGVRDARWAMAPPRAS